MLLCRLEKTVDTSLDNTAVQECVLWKMTRDSNWKKKKKRKVRDDGGKSRAEQTSREKNE